MHVEDVEKASAFIFALYQSLRVVRFDWPKYKYALAAEVTVTSQLKINYEGGGLCDLSKKRSLLVANQP